MICSTATDIYTISTNKQKTFVLIAPRSLFAFPYQKIVVTFFFSLYNHEHMSISSMRFYAFHLLFIVSRLLFYCKISKPLKFMASLIHFIIIFFFKVNARECEDSFNKIKSLTDTHWAINGLLFMCDSYIAYDRI